MHELFTCFFRPSPPAQCSTNICMFRASCAISSPFVIPFMSTYSFSHCLARVLHSVRHLTTVVTQTGGRDSQTKDPSTSPPWPISLELNPASLRTTCTGIRFKTIVGAYRSRFYSLSNFCVSSRYFILLHIPSEPHDHSRSRSTHVGLSDRSHSHGLSFIGLGQQTVLSILNLFLLPFQRLLAHRPALIQ